MLTKLLMMTTSSHDGEALVAIRKANEMLARDRLNWQGVMKRLQSAKPYEAPKAKPREEPKPKRKRARDQDEPEQRPDESDREYTLRMFRRLHATAPEDDPSRIS